MTMPVNINAASIEELMTVTGIGQVTAEAIVRYRQEVELFQSIDQLAKVGLRGERLERLKPYLSVGENEYFETFEEEEPEAQAPYPNSDQASKNEEVMPPNWYFAFLDFLDLKPEGPWRERWVRFYLWARGTGNRAQAEVKHRATTTQQRIAEKKAQTRSQQTIDYKMPQIREVGENAGVVRGIANQFVQVGFVVDMWAQLIDGFGEEDNTNRFVQALKERIDVREMKRVERAWKPLPASGLTAPTRLMEFYKRNKSTVTLYIATQGRDLYISWRAFVQPQLIFAKFVLLVLVGLATGVPFATETYREGWRGPTRTRFVTEDYVVAAGGAIALLFVLALVWGFNNRKGDYWAFFRGGVNEFDVDDTEALIQAVHGSILAAADQVGIDTTKLEQREPFYTPKNRLKRRF